MIIDRTRGSVNKKAKKCKWNSPGRCKVGNIRHPRSRTFFLVICKRDGIPGVRSIIEGITESVENIVTMIRITYFSFSFVVRKQSWILYPHCRLVQVIHVHISTSIWNIRFTLWFQDNDCVFKPLYTKNSAHVRTLLLQSAPLPQEIVLALHDHRDNISSVSSHTRTHYNASMLISRLTHTHARAM